VQTDTTEEETDWESDMDENPGQIEESDTELETAQETVTVSDTSEPEVPPSTTEAQPVPETIVEDTESRVHTLDPEDYVTQDEETYQHYYRETGNKKFKKEEE
jgi:hypothetical protein